MKTTRYAAIRKTEDREWIDTSTIGFFMEDTVAAVHKTSKMLPTYANDNPVVRYSQVTISE